MKKILLALFAVATLFTACESTFNDQFDGLEESVQAPYIDAQAIALTSDHYTTISKEALKDAVTAEDSTKAKSIASNEYFSDDVKSVDYIPYLLNIEYSTFDKGAPCVVTYNYSAAKSTEVIDYTSTTEYVITDADYESIGGDVATYHVFIDEEPATTHLPTILAAANPNAVEGDRILASYEFTDVVTDPSVSFVLAKEDYTIIVEKVANDPELNKYLSSYGNNEYYYGASYYYDNFDNRTDKRKEFAADVYDALTMTDAEILALILEKNQDALVYLLETKYPNAVEEIEGKTVYYSMNYHTFSDGYINADPNVVYKVTAGSSPAAFELVEGPTEDELNYSASTSASASTYYVYDGSDWAPEEGIYNLTSADYASMGVNDFYSSKPAENYLPSFLNTMYPYAQDGDQIYVGYIYDGDYEVNLYTYDNGWTSTPAVSEVSEQYVFKQITWVFDPSVTFEMDKSDFEIIVNSIKNDPVMDIYMDEKYDNQEYYYGAGYYYGNFDVQLYKRQNYDAENFPADISEDDANEIIEERLVEAIYVLLKEKYPTAVPTVNGADVFYNVQFSTYHGSGVYSYLTIKYQCTSNGDFTFVEGPYDTE